MSAPRAIAELVVDGIRIFGKAMSAAGRQAARNARHKPEGAPDSRPVGSGSSKSQITNQLQMSLDEAHMILNVKKDDTMEIIQKHYDTIFKANSPPPPPTAPAPGSKPVPTPRTGASSKTSKTPTHSHYLQSKVYRALERIKAERAVDEPAPPPEGGEGATAAASGEATGSGTPGSSGSA